MKSVMTRISNLFVLLIIVSLSFCSLRGFAAPPTAANTIEFPEIKIRDQFRIEHTTESLFPGKKSSLPLVVIASDQRQTEKYIHNWVNLLQEALGDRIQYVGLANLRGLPFFVSKNSIRSSLKKKFPNIPILCDWKGKGFQQLACIRGQQNVQVYSIDRKLAGSITGKADEESLKKVIALIERASKTAELKTENK